MFLSPWCAAMPPSTHLAGAKMSASRAHTLLMAVEEPADSGRMPADGETRGWGGQNQTLVWNGMVTGRVIKVACSALRYVVDGCAAAHVNQSTKKLQ